MLWNLWIWHLAFPNCRCQWGHHDEPVSILHGCISRREGYHQPGSLFDSYTPKNHVAWHQQKPGQVPKLLISWASRVTDQFTGSQSVSDFSLTISSANSVDLTDDYCVQHHSSLLTASLSNTNLFSESDHLTALHIAMDTLFICLTASVLSILMRKLERLSRKWITMVPPRSLEHTVFKFSV